MKLLIVDDDKVTRELLKEVFEGEGFTAIGVGSAEAACEFLEKETIEIVLSDIRMVEMDGLQLLTFIKNKKLASVVILMTGFGNMEGAVQAIREGAFDYLSKPFKMDDIKAVVGRAARHYEMVNAPTVGQTLRTGFHGRSFIGKSAGLVEIYKTVARASLSEATVLISGESGTGKELVARAIHENSRRQNKRFLAINCSALSETLLESELFGHVKGAFTGAIQSKTGLFEEAHEGTLFLDEIGDISLSMQVKLLRALQDGEVRPVGGNDTIKFDARIIAASHVNLEAKVREGRFREDLYYRLKVISIELPPLRHRMEDLCDLVEYFVSSYSARTGKKISHVSEDAMKSLQRYSWPGNVRELEHAIESAIAMTRTTVLYPEDFPPEIVNENASTSSKSQDSTGSLEQMEKEWIQKVVEESNFNRSKAASILGIDRKTLQRKVERYGIRFGVKQT